MDKEFCLLDEKWIKVLNRENKIEEVSLIDIFRNAHLYKKLAGENATQDAAIFRILLAIAITVFYRCDADGNEYNVLDYDDPEDEVLSRWLVLWKKGSFNGEIYQRYLEKFRERFYLFHPETPFWQVNGLEQGTDYKIINLFGNVKESNNKETMHHFHMTDGEYVKNISYAEATRWLIYTNAYSINVKTKADGKNVSTGVGRLGQLGLILADAENLFQKIMLNLCALNSADKAWGNPRPIWEMNVRTAPGVEIALPDNLPELYTLQSRRLFLKRERKEIVGFRSIGGDYYSSDINDITEPMTLLAKKKNEVTIVPQKIKKEIMAWREFPSLLPDNEKEKSGLIVWLEHLIEEECIDVKSMITFKLIGLEYGDKWSYTNGDLIEQSLSISKGFLDKIGKEWVLVVIRQIKKCEQVAKLYLSFSKKILKNTDDNAVTQLKNFLAEQYYYHIDKTFREWLLSIEPESKQRDSKESEWEKQSYKIAEWIVEEYVAGHCLQDMIKAADAMNVFKLNLNKIYEGRRNE